MHTRAWPGEGGEGLMPHFCSPPAPPSSPKTLCFECRLTLARNIPDRQENWSPQTEVGKEVFINRVLNIFDSSCLKVSPLYATWVVMVT